MVCTVQYGLVLNVNKIDKNIFLFMKQGDKVKCTTHPGEWTLVWYKEGDHTCAIQNDKYRYIVKVATLTLAK